ncbi:MAG: toxin-antitoxin system protein [Deltaproteobacteria bacterium]|nr:toxin-antitoxin system protein [Deltaproteobacteria bacterium]
MATPTIRISKTTHELLHTLASQDNTSMQAIVEQAIEHYRRQRFLEGLSADFTNLRENNESWHDELQERQQWDIALGDGEKA